MVFRTHSAMPELENGARYDNRRPQREHDARRPGGSGCRHLVDLEGHEGIRESSSSKWIA
jgi:hypothetical protein